AIAGRAPDYGLHRTENRRATVVIDISALDPAFLSSEVAWPILGNLFGRSVGTNIGVVAGGPAPPDEDDHKGFGAASASVGAVCLFHIAGVTPEAPDLETALQHQEPEGAIRVTQDMIETTPKRLSTVERVDHIDAVAIGSPQLSMAEFDRLEPAIAQRKLAVPVYACTGCHAL